MNKEETVLYSDFYGDIYCAEARDYARVMLYLDHAANADEDNIGKWGSPDDVYDSEDDEFGDEVEYYLENYERNCLESVIWDIRSALKGKNMILCETLKSDDGTEKAKYGFVSDLFSLTGDGGFTRIVDRDGDLFVEDDNPCDSTRSVRIVTKEGMDFYNDKKDYYLSSPQKQQEIFAIMFNRDEFSEKPNLVKGPLNGKDFSTVLTPENAKKLVENFETPDPRTFRVGEDGWIDLKAYKDRMSRLCKEDRHYAERLFKADPSARTAYFGGTYDGNKGAADTMLKLVSAASKSSGGELAQKDLNRLSVICRGSYCGENLSGNDADRMATEAYGLVKQFNAMIDKYNESHAKERPDTPGK